MLHSHHKNTILVRIPLLVFLISFWVITLNTSHAAATADWGDVVDVHYFRYTNPDYTGIAEDNEITHIYLSQGSTVPADVVALFPGTGISAAYFSDFKAGIIGLSLNGQNQFTAQEGSQYYYFLVRLLSIRYDADAVIDGSTTSSTTTSTPAQTVDTLFLIGVGVIIVVGIVFYTAVRGNQQRKRALSEESSSTSRRERSISEKKIKLKELRELAELHDPSVDVEEPTKPDVKFRRRR